jgi:5-methylcytosine-specific restriction enzyme subunit McrC
VSKLNVITVFEYESLSLKGGKNSIIKDQLTALQTHYGNGIPFYSLIHNGVKFNEHVGVIQVGNTIIEVLPKADKSSSENKWRNLLIGMLRTVLGFDLKATSNANLKIKPNHILDLYVELFIKEVEYLLRSGLVKKYKKEEGNVSALKGNLLFSKHIQVNLTHQERFYVRSTAYNTEHPIHQILFKTICLLKQINTNAALHSRIGSLFLNFPEMPDLKVIESTFSKIILNRKTQHYKNVLDIARMLLLNYHPDISKGRNDVLALMFDMNKLWEQFVYASLRKAKNISVTAQTSKYFWKPERGNRSRIRADILINKGKPDCIVLDTKWKNLNGYNPSPEDLRQMFVYQEYYGANRVALVYPGENQKISSGNYLAAVDANITNKECKVITLAVNENIKNWQDEICSQVNQLMK